MRVVSNTSPLSNLAIIGRLDLLKARYTQLFIPDAVRRELLRLSHAEGARGIQQALSEGWLVVESVSDTSVIPIFLTRVDEGEAEAIELARQTKAELLLIDDLAGRRLANELGLSITGLLGVLAEAKLTHRIPSLQAELRRLRQEAGFFVSHELENLILERVGENPST